MLQFITLVVKKILKRAEEHADFYEKSARDVARAENHELRNTFEAADLIAIFLTKAQHHFDLFFETWAKGF